MSALPLPIGTALLLIILMIGVAFRLTAPVRRDDHLTEDPE